MYVRRKKVIKMLKILYSPIKYSYNDKMQHPQNIGKQNTYNNSELSFQSKWITKAEQKSLVENLEKCKAGKPSSMQLVYQICQDFVNRRIKLIDYLQRMDYAAMQVNKNREFSNPAEKKFIIDFLLHSFIDNTPDTVKKADVIEALTQLTAN